MAAAPPSPMPSAEPDQPRPRSSRSLHADDANHSFEVDTEDESKAIVELAVIMTASTPVTPGPSSPPLDQHRNQDLAPPTRPSSTPFLYPEPRNDDIQYARAPADVSHDLSMQSTAVPPSPCEAEPPAQGLETLPLEIHECILDHLFGYRVSPTSKSSLAVPRATTSISAMLRHSRRRELSQLALVNKLWRATVQQRLFRHIRVKASNEELEKAMTFFIEHPHLRDCVKHIEVWFPVFHPKLSTPPFGTPNMALPTMTDTGFAMTSYTLPPDNCTLDEVFYFVGTTFPDVQVLTLEGGDRRKAPKVKVFRHPHIQQHLPVIKSVKTLVTKGQWNLIRSEEDFSTIVTALTCLQEWHGQYSKPKSKGYLTMSPVLQRLPSHLKRLHLMLEADYRRELAFPAFFLKVMAQVHFCSPLAEAVSKLEHLSYTGRVCHNFFDLAARKAESRTTILRSVDITVRNCCRKVTQLHDAGSGITDMSFINAFEVLVLSAIRSMEKLTKLNFLKLRYVDLESPVPSLNPFFEIRNGKCYGVWSEKIITELNRVRPNVEFAELNDSFGPIGQFKDGRMVISPDFPRTRITSLKLGNYAMLQGATIATST